MVDTEESRPRNARSSRQGRCLTIRLPRITLSLVTVFAVSWLLVATSPGVTLAQLVSHRASDDDLVVESTAPATTIPTRTIPTQAIPPATVPSTTIPPAAVSPTAAFRTATAPTAVPVPTDSTAEPPLSRPPMPIPDTVATGTQRTGSQTPLDASAPHPATVSPKSSADLPSQQVSEAAPSLLSMPVDQGWTSPSGLSRTLQTALGLSVLSLAPAILLMTTSFVRISVVLGLLRQGLGTQMVPSNQVITSLALFMTILIMAPIWQQVYTDAIEPYTNPDVDMQWQEAWALGVAPVRRFMSHQIDVADNDQDIWLFYEYLPEGTPEPETDADIPLQVLLPAFLMSELKIAFLIGFRIYLPFLIVDLVVSSVTTSMGMMMLPPMMVSLPLKLMLFVLVDGWHLVVGMLLQSFGTMGM